MGIKLEINGNGVGNENYLIGTGGNGSINCTTAEISYVISDHSVRIQRKLRW